MAKSPLGIAIADANGDLAAGILLYRVRYWQPRAVVKFGSGGAWIAKTRLDWCDETSLTLKQYKRALALLLRLGKVESSIHKFGGRTMTHLRTRSSAEIPSMGAPAVSPGSVPAVPQGSIQMVPTGSTQVVPPGYTVIDMELPTGDKNKEFCANAQEASMEDDKLVAIGSSNKPLDQVQPAKFFTRLELAYRAAFKDTTGYLAASWGPKARGQMKLVTEHLKQEGLSPDKQIEVVAKIVRKWEVFTSYIYKEMGKYMVPDTPSVEYLAAHRQCIWPFYDQFCGEKSAMNNIKFVSVDEAFGEDDA